jgi:hypothetical protein
MSQTDWNADTWKKEDPIPGSMHLPENDALANLLSDGMTSYLFDPKVLTDHFRSASQSFRIQTSVQRSDVVNI